LRGNLRRLNQLSSGGDVAVGAVCRWRRVRTVGGGWCGRSMEL